MRGRMFPRPGGLDVETVSFERPETWQRRAASLLAMLLVSGLLACSGTSGSGQPLEIPEEPELTPSGLALVRKTPRSMLWVRPDHHIGQYDDVLITGVGFTYGPGQTELSPQQETQVQEMLVEAMNAFTEPPSPVGRAAQPGPCVVAVQLGLKDMRLHINETAATGSAISFVDSFGSATLLMEFRDSTSDQVLIRYASHRGLGGGPGTGRVGANLPRLGRALGEMVTDMTNELQTITPSTTVRSETECNDGIYKLTGRTPT